MKTGAEFFYVYDDDGNIVRSIDISAEKEYNYEYEEGRIVRATEADIELSGEIVTSKAIVNTVKYYYDSEGKMTRKVITPAGGSAQTIYYETNDDNTVVKFSAGGRTVTSHSKTDSFGRKVFDELQLGTDFVSRQFVYHAGKVTAEHKEKAKVKSSATTQLVSQIILSDGRTLSYEYDAEERITSITEKYTVDKVETTDTTSYTYDALGQLLTETNVVQTIDRSEEEPVVTVTSKLVNSMEYDNYGNILKKNGIVYNYGDSKWRDLLTSYNGQSITYDAQGNPTSYLGHTLTWEKGRQLKSFDGNTYTYNANGIRTSKTVNGVKHEYTLDGTKILRETWDSNTLIPLYDNEDSVCGILYNNVPYYFIKNLQGDVIAILDKDAQTVARYTYDAWGVPEIKLDSSTGQIATINPFRYRGYYYDQSIGLYYLQSRYYDPQVGRFVNGDEAVILNISNELLSCNLFCYCENNSVNESDYGGTLSVDGFLNHVKAFFVGIGRFFSSLTINLKNIYTPYKRSGKYIYINTLVISLVIDLIILLVSRAVSLGLKGILTGIKSLAKFFKNSVKNIIKDIILPFFRKTIKTYLKPLFTFILKKIGLSFLKNVVIYATDNSLPNAGTLCSWLLSSVYSAGDFISFILDLYDGKLDNYYCIQAT